MADDEVVKLSDISDFGQNTPAGRYRCKLASVNGKMSKADPPSPMVEAIYDIMDGGAKDGSDQSGTTINLYYSLKITESTTKQGKKQKWAPGISDLKAAFAAIGQPLSDDVVFSMRPTEEQAQQRAVEYGKAFNPQKGQVEIVVIEEDRKKKNPATGKWETSIGKDGAPEKTRGRITGWWKQSGNAASAPNALEGIGLG